MNNLMMDKARDSFDVPVLFILFNRPEHARKVMERIRQIRPIQLFVAIDGPRAGVNNDDIGVQQCLALLDEIDWPCTVNRLIRDQNLGCKVAVSSAISWFFEHVEYGIILEDDCLPDVTFFEFCRILLLKYANESKVMHIGGANLYEKLNWGPYSFFFSKIAHIWGWATWRRAWALYDVNMGDYYTFKKAGGISEVVSYPSSRSFWEKTFEAVYNGNIDTWDFQWVFAIWKNQGLSIIPNQNLITNIGFGAEATHTNTESEFANNPTTPINIDTIVYPDSLDLNKEAINYAFAKFYQLPSLWLDRINRLKKMIATQKSAIFNFANLSNK